ncbi:MAG: sulfatase-like hydrolase/transferase [Planctomycetota bacterium]
MIHRKTLSTAVLLGAACALAPAPAWAQPEPAPRPNIIFILADDVGIGDLGPYGQQTLLTPNLDALANQGVAFDQMYSGAPVCSPSRAILMTGLHNGRHVNGNGVNLQANNVTVAEVLRDAGYATGGFGKWHIGGSGQSLPTMQGFDDYYGILGGVAAWDHFRPTMERLSSDAPTTIVTEVNNGNFTDDLVGAEAAQFVRSHAGSGQPFYAQVNFQLAHFDMEVPELEPYTVNQDWPESRKIFASMITRLDRLVGEVVQAVDDPNGDGDTSDSMAENTLIVFASDNGTHIEPQNCCKGNHGPDIGFFSDEPHDPEFFDSNGVYRGNKRDLYDGGIKTPFIARWAGTIDPGQRNTDHFGDFADFLPTAAELAGARNPVGIDGESLVHVLTGETGPDDFERDFQYFEGAGSLGGLPSPVPLRALIQDGYKAIQFNNGTIELYDLQADPSESNNLFASMPTLAQSMIDTAVAQDGGQVAYRTTAAQNVFADDGAAWGGGAINGNAIATVRSDGASDANVFARLDTGVLALEVDGQAGATSFTVLSGASLDAANGVQVNDGGVLRLEGAALDTARRVELFDGTLAGRGVVTGPVMNRGVVTPDGLSSAPPAAPPMRNAALELDFAGVQDDAPLSATSLQHPLLTVVSGLDFGPGAQPRSAGPNGITSTDAGNEFNVSGLNASSLAGAIAASDYLTYTVAPVAGFGMRLQGVEFDLWRNGGGAATDYAILTSLDGFVAGAELAQLNGVGSSGESSRQTFAGEYTGTQDVAGSLEVRLYGWNADGSLSNTHVDGVRLDATFTNGAGAPSLSFNFLGVQDDAPLGATLLQDPRLEVVSGLAYGPGAQPRSAAPDGNTSTDAGDEFNAGGFNASSLAGAISAGDYLGFAVQPAEGFAMRLSGVRADLWRNGVNAANDYAILTSAVGFADGLALGQLNDVITSGPLSEQTFAVSTSGGLFSTDVTEVRLYGWNANDNLASTHFTSFELDAVFTTTGTAAAAAAITSQDGGPFGELRLEGDYLQFFDGALELDLGGIDVGVDLDRLSIAGDAYLDGTLRLVTTGGYDPTPYAPHRIVSIDAGSSVSGAFSQIEGVAIDPDHGWAVTYDAQGVLATAALLGDFNLDGVVDLLDFDVLASAFGDTQSGWSTGDANGDGVVDLLDFDALAGNFGAASPGVVPEPGSLALTAAAWVLLGRRRSGLRVGR